VIEHEVEDRLAEEVRLRRALRNFAVPVDVIVMDEALVKRRTKVKGTMVIVRCARGALSPSPEHVEYAEMLLRRARGDAYACRVLAEDVEIDDGAIGFHAQQAVEKALKVALVLADVELPRTHDLAQLVEKVLTLATEVPDELSRMSRPSTKGLSQSRRFHGAERSFLLEGQKS
jgi:HEPN domain-containing protein